ncbi:MAG: non-heme iron oxygenase ferredoxin subunit [Pseudorhodoplanes sp.]
MTSATDTLQFVSVAKESEVAPGAVIKIDVAGLQLAVFNVDGTFYATDEICTHAYASLAEGYVDGDTVECPLHGACFSIKTGAALSAPATEALRTYPIRIANGEILVGVPA